MSFVSIALHQDETPWAWPLRLGGGLQMLRSRCFLEAIDSVGRTHWAELAPCPGVHPETLDEALEAFPELVGRHFKEQNFQWTQPFFGLLDAPTPIFTSVLAAMEQLLLSWMQSQNKEECSLPAPMTLPGSALLSLQGWPEFLEQWEQGFRVFKCKIGRHAAAADYALLQRMQDFAKGGLELRLDANQNLPDADRDFWQQRAATLPIAYWEESPGLGPTALDETLWDAGDAPADTWILKPTRLGLSRSIQLLKKAAQEQRRCVLSNAFDSGLTLRVSAWIYAAFCHDPQALGFGTTRFLPNDRWQSHSWGAARVTIPEQPYAAV